MEKKLHMASIKALDERGEGQAIIATLNTVDKDGDVSVPGCFGEQICSMVAAHDWEEVPIGKGRIHEMGDEVVADFQMNLNTDTGRNWYEALKFDFEHPPARQEYSYGYTVQKYSFGSFSDNQRVRFLERVEVHEFSPVLVGAGVGTRTLGLKRKDLDQAVDQVLKAMERKGPQIKKSRFDLIADISEKAGLEQALVYRILSGDEPAKGTFFDAASAILGITFDQAKPIAREESKCTVPSHSSKTSDSLWDAVSNERNVKKGESAAYYRRVYGWYDSAMDAGKKGAYKFAHHFVDQDGVPGAASVRACILGIEALNGARNGTTIPEQDRRKVWDHLAHHLEDAEVAPPVLRSIDDVSCKLADQLLWLVWDTEVAISRVEELKQMRAKDNNRNIPEERIDQIRELKGLMERLDALLKSPNVDQRIANQLARMQELRMRSYR